MLNRQERREKRAIDDRKKSWARLTSWRREIFFVDGGGIPCAIALVGLVERRGFHLYPDPPLQEGKSKPDGMK